MAKTPPPSHRSAASAAGRIDSVGEVALNNIRNWLGAASLIGALAMTAPYGATLPRHQLFSPPTPWYWADTLGQTARRNCMPSCSSRNLSDIAAMGGQYSALLAHPPPVRLCLAGALFTACAQVRSGVSPPVNGGDITAGAGAFRRPHHPDRPLGKETSALRQGSRQTTISLAADARQQHPQPPPAL